MMNEPLVDAHQEYDRARKSRRKNVALCILLFILAGLLGPRTIDKGDYTSPLAVTLWVLCGMSLVFAFVANRRGKKMLRIEKELAVVGRKP